MKGFTRSLIVCAFLAGAFAAPPDPAAERASGTPAAFDRLTFHHAPKPLPEGAVVEDWPRFLGRLHNATSRETKLLRNWPDGGPARLWEVERGAGYAGPAIAGGRLVLFHHLKDRDVVDCLDPESGRRHWSTSWPTDYRDRYGYNNGPRASPVIAGGRVYVFGVAGMLKCLDLKSGKVVWERDLAADHRLRPVFFGLGCTPLVLDGRVIVNVAIEDGPSILAFDATTGKRLWGAEKTWGASYSAPVPVELHGHKRVLVLTGGESRPPAGGLVCLDPATGKIDFRVPFRAEKFESVNASCPVVIGGRILLSQCYPPSSGLFLRVAPDLTRAEVAWNSSEFGMHFMTPVHSGGFLYGFPGRHTHTAEIVCLDAAAGKVKWREMLEWDWKRGNGQSYRMGMGRASLLAAGGAFLALGESGALAWLDLSPKGCRIMERAQLFLAPETWTLPALSRGLLYVSQNHKDMDTGKSPRLICYDLRGQ